MDILNAPVININGRLYCKYPIEGVVSRPQNLPEEQDDFYDDAEEDDEPGCFEDVVKSTSRGFEATISDIPSALFGYIIGTRAETKKKIERETKTRINFPERGTEGDIHIVGEAKKNVVSASNRIKLIAVEKRGRQKPTHFLSIPLNTEDIGSALDAFKETVLSFSELNNSISEDLFQSPKKFHLTIGVLVLLNESEILKAKRVFKECMESEIIKTICQSRMNVVVEGIEYMNDDPGMVDVLYAKVRLADGSDSLQVLVDTLAKYFQDEGLMKKQYDSVKLHATVINTLFRNQKADGSTYKYTTKTRQTFDAKAILSNIPQFHFGEFTLSEIHLSERFSTDVSGYYKAADVIKL